MIQLGIINIIIFRSIPNPIAIAMKNLSCNDTEIWNMEFHKTSVTNQNEMKRNRMAAMHHKI